VVQNKVIGGPTSEGHGMHQQIFLDLGVRILIHEEMMVVDERGRI
jgi:hypothetical protein